MDDETRAAIDSLISGKPRKVAPAAPPPSSGKAYGDEGDDWRSYSSKPSRIWPRPDDSVPPVSKSASKPSPTFCYNEAEKHVNLKQEIATLSVDTSSASIVFKGVITDTLRIRIESAIPATQRDWDESKRVWRFAPTALNSLKVILKDVYKDVQLLGVPKALPSTKFDQLISKLDKSDKAQIYKLLAQKYHPDKGGSHEVMTLINVVFREG